MRRETVPTPLREDQSGFTLPEVTITVVVMGILFAIASSSWLGIVESREVDSGTNQLVADLRLAHSRATNQLAPQRLVLDGDSTYQVGPPAALQTRTLPGGVVVGASATFTFEPDGSVSGSPVTFEVRASDGGPVHEIQMNAATSRVRVVG